MTPELMKIRDDHCWQDKPCTTDLQCQACISFDAAVKALWPLVDVVSEMTKEEDCYLWESHPIKETLKKIGVDV